MTASMLDSNNMHTAAAALQQPAPASLGEKLTYIRDAALRVMTGVSCVSSGIDPRPKASAPTAAQSSPGGMISISDEIIQILTSTDEDLDFVRKTMGV